MIYDVIEQSFVNRPIEDRKNDSWCVWSALWSFGTNVLSNGSYGVLEFIWFYIKIELWDSLSFIYLNRQFF